MNGIEHCLLPDSTQHCPAYEKLRVDNERLAARLAEVEKDRDGWRKLWQEKDIESARFQRLLTVAKRLLRKCYGYKTGSVGDYHMDNYVWPEVALFIDSATGSAPDCAHPGFYADG